MNLIQMLVTSRVIAYSPVAYGQYNHFIYVIISIIIS